MPAILGAGAEAPSQSPDPPVETSGKGLVVALGSANWDERESAQLRLLEEGLSVAPLLEQAMRSENLELAYRARYLLARIDPRITAFQVIRLGTGSRVEVIDAAVAAGMEGEELSARPIAGDADSGGYTIQFRTEGARSAEGDADDGARLPVGNGRLELWISKARQGNSVPEARCDIAAPAAIAVVHRGEECLYTRMGLEIARERRAYITIVRVKTGRRSLLEKEPFSTGKEAIFEEVIRDLDAQLLAPDPEDRSAAIEILGELGRYRGPIEEHLADPDTRDAAAYASGKPELLEDVLERASRDEDAPPGRVSLTVRSAAKLAARGSSRAAVLLLERLLDPEPPHPHLLLASLADAVREGKLPRQTRLDVERRALGDETLTRVPWDDVESEYFFSALIAALDPEVEEERDLAREFLSSLERLARGELGPVAVRLRTVIELWRRAARKAPGANAVESRMLLGILPHLNGAASFSEAASILEDALMRETTRGETDADLLEGFLAILTGNIAEGDPGIINVSFQSLLRLSRAFPGSRGQLAPLARALIGACESAYRDPGAPPRGTQRAVSPATPLLRQAEDILAGWTGVRPSPEQPGTTRKPDSSAWRSWLDDPSRVESREAELLAARSSSTEAAASRFVLYEFDLATGEPKKGLPRARVLDARRLEVRLSQPILYRDRWGNEVQVRIDPEPRGDANPTRFRVSSRSMLFAGLPALTPVQGRDLSTSRHDSSDLTTSSTPMPGVDAPGFRSLVLLLPAGEDPEAPTGAPPDELWSWFLEHRLLVLPEDATSQRVQAVINIVRQLELRQAAPLVRRLFDKAPTADRARLLYELGDEAGVPFLLAELAKGDDARVRASITLLELGHADGFAGLQGADVPSLRRMHLQVGTALDAYLKHPRATPEGKEKALRFVFDLLDDEAYQPKVFGIIQRETGIDFGYASARGIDDQERRAAALKACVKAARDWIQARPAAK